MKILVVDNDPGIRDLVKDLVDFNIDGATVVFGINGKDGWREFQDSRPVLVITDLRMETNDAGFELARKIKARSPNTPIIMITSKVEATDAVDCFLEKPFKNEDFVAKIKELLERKEVG